MHKAQDWPIGGLDVAAKRKLLSLPGVEPSLSNPQPVTSINDKEEEEIIRLF
jgi:hypothetical protein